MIRNRSYRYAETVVRIRPAKVADRYSGETTRLDYANATRADIANVVVAPRSSAEPSGSGRVITTLGLAFPAGTDIAATDRVEVRGTEYAIDGDVVDFVHPITGSRPGAVATLRRVTS